MISFPVMSLTLISKSLLIFVAVFYPAGIYLLIVKNENTRTMSKICSNLTITKKVQYYKRHFGAFIVNFNIFHTSLWVFHCWIWVSNCHLSIKTTYILIYCWQNLLNPNMIINTINVRYSYAFLTPNMLSWR